MDSINTLAGPVNAAAFTDESATAYGSAVMAEVAQLVSKTNEVIGGLTVVAADLDTVEATASSLQGSATTASADIAALEAAVGDTTGMAPATIITRLAALETETNVGAYSDENDLTMTADLFKVIDMAGTSTPQVITLPDPNSGGFIAGQSWIINCDNLAGVRFAKSADTVMASYFGSASSADTTLMNGDTAILAVVEYGGSLLWSLAVARAGLDFSQASGVTFPYTVPTHIRSVIVNRSSHTGTKSIVLPRLDNDTNDILHGHEIMVLLYGTKSSGDVEISVNGSSTDIILGAGTGSSATSITATENSVYRFRAFCGAIHAWVLL